MKALLMPRQRGLLIFLVDLVLLVGLRRIAQTLVGTAAAAAIATLTLTGSVPHRLSITVTPTAAATSLDLAINRSLLKVADLVAVANSPLGYNVAVESGNAAQGRCSGPCFHSPTTNESLPFSLHRNDASISFGGANAEFVRSARKSEHDGDSYAVQVSYDGAPMLLSPGNDYREVLTFTVSTN